MDSRITGDFSSQKVSPVVVSFKPTAAAMSPEYTRSISFTGVSVHLKNTTDTFFLPLVELKRRSRIPMYRSTHGRTLIYQHKGQP